MLSCLKMTKEDKDEMIFMKNGSMLLEELIASCNGKCNPIRTFSAKELNKATNNYDRGQEIIEDGDYILYKGFLQDHPISVKKYKDYKNWGLVGSPITDIVIGSQMSVHQHVLKLIGCCLETEHPLIVYEFIGNETLSTYLSDNHRQLLPWKYRIKIVLCIANAVAYLHTALARPVIHRDISPATILVGQDYDAKLMDFSLSISIPAGQSHAEDAVRGRREYSAPEYIVSGHATEKLDVYCFGILLLQLLTGQKKYGVERDNVFHALSDFVNQYIENRQLIEIVDPTILKEGIEEQELLAFTTLALSCICKEAEGRPTMMVVAKELKRINQSLPCPF